LGKVVVGLGRFELPTLGLGNSCPSIQGALEKIVFSFVFIKFKKFFERREDRANGAL